MRRIEITEDRSIPLDGLVLGYGPVLLFPLAAIAAWLAPPEPARMAAEGARLLGAALLCFLAGIRRGLSFRTEGGPRLGQIADMLGLFFTGLAAFVLPLLWGLALLSIRFATLVLFSPGQAKRGEVPLYFARLRPPQMTIATVGLLVLTGWAAGQ